MIAAVALVRQAVAPVGHVAQAQVHRVRPLPLGLVGPAVVGNVEFQMIVAFAGAVLAHALVHEGGDVLKAQVLPGGVGQRGLAAGDGQPRIGLQVIVGRQAVGASTFSFKTPPPVFFGFWPPCRPSARTPPPPCFFWWGRRARSPPPPPPPSCRRGLAGPLPPPPARPPLASLSLGRGGCWPPPPSCSCSRSPDRPFPFPFFVHCSFFSSFFVLVFPSLRLPFPLFPPSSRCGAGRAVRSCCRRGPAAPSPVPVAGAVWVGGLAPLPPPLLRGRVLPPGRPGLPAPALSFPAARPSSLLELPLALPNRNRIGKERKKKELFFLLFSPLPPLLLKTSNPQNYSLLFLPPPSLLPFTGSRLYNFVLSTPSFLSSRSRRSAETSSAVLTRWRTAPR